MKYYLERPSLQDHSNFSDSLFNETGQNDNNSDSGFETPLKLPNYQNIFRKLTQLQSSLGQMKFKKTQPAVWKFRLEKVTK